ncbi:hypothetical protein DENSPDRAFT_932995 [Dentipellis sp. KUC8613]|nr:hypothetical protein DENSPDRAFT_932995 [Dentipellis sp. KUC8613]
MKQITVDEMFKTYMPGPDPSSEMQAIFAVASTNYAQQDNNCSSTDAKDEGKDIRKAKTRKTTWEAWRCMIEICKISHSVVEAAYSTGTTLLGPRYETYATSNWPVQLGIQRKEKRKRDDATEFEEGKRGTRPDGGVYLVNERTEHCVAISDATFQKESKISDADKTVRTGFVGHCSWADLIVPIEIKVERSHSAFTFTDKCEKFLLESDEGTEALGQILEYVGQVFTHQHRMHVFALYVFRFQARILYFDRSGCIVSEPFEYGTGTDTPLHRFFWRLAHMSTEQRGYDCSAELASEEEVQGMLDYASDGAPTEYIKQQIYHALTWDLGVGKPRSTQWPAYRVRVDGRTLLIARPMASSQSLHGRCTRGYLAFDPQEKSVSFMKDFWRPDVERIQPEHEVYDRLASFHVSNIATCIAHEDVRDSQDRWQVTRTQDTVDPGPRLRRGHYRMMLREVCRPLIDFKDFRELASLLCDAMTAHEDAWYKAGVLHRDISVNNILILETGSNDNITRRGILNDWDLCKYKEQMGANISPRQAHLTGTWYFRSALSLKYPQKPYRLSDDIESFIYVFHYCVYRFHQTDATYRLEDVIRGTYEAVKTRDGVRTGGEEKMHVMRLGNPPMDTRANHMLDRCLRALHKVYQSHYKAIDLVEYRRLYDPDYGVPQPGDVDGVASESSDAGDSASDSDDEDSVERGEKLLDTPDRLKDVFSRYGGQAKNDHGRPAIVWKTRYLTKSEDLFAYTSLLERKNAQLSSDAEGAFESIATDVERPVKRQRIGNMMSTTLLSIAESQCEEMSS